MEPRHGACRIGVLINSSFWSGMEGHTVELVGLLAGRGHEVTIAELGKPVIAESGRLPTALGVRLLQANPGLQLNQVGLRHWLRYIRGLQTDVVVFVKGSTDDGSVRLDLAARLCCRRFMTIEQMTPPPRPVYSRGSHLGGLLPGLGLWWYRQMAPVYLRSLGPKRIVGVSHAVARELRAYGFPGRKLPAVPHGADAERYQRSPAHRAPRRAARECAQRGASLPTRCCSAAWAASIRITRARISRSSCWRGSASATRGSGSGTCSSAKVRIARASSSSPSSSDWRS